MKRFERQRGELPVGVGMSRTDRWRDRVSEGEGRMSDRKRDRESRV